MSKTVFKVGMKVYDSVNFPGQELMVVEIMEDNDYSITVHNQNEEHEYYTYTGGLLDSSIPTLSTTPYTVEFKGFSQEEPLKKGQIVWVRDGEDEKWKIAHFLKIQEGEYKYKVSSSQNDGSSSNWKMLTTQNPYENIE